MKFFILCLAVLTTVPAFSQGRAPTSGDGRTFHANSSGGGGGGYGHAPMGLGGSGYGAWNYPQGSVGPWPSRPQPVVQTPPPVTTPPVVTSTPPIVVRTPRQNLYRAVDYFVMDDRRNNGVRDMVSQGNPCTGCESTTCNQDYLERELRRICEENPRCPCGGTCDNDLVVWYMDRYLSTMAQHNTIVPEAERGRSREEGLEPGQRHRTPSPTLERSYPEAVLLPALHRLALPVAEGIISIGTALDRYRDSHDYPRIETPYGVAEQNVSPEALALRERVEAGDTIYRIGTREGTITRNGTPHQGSNTGPTAQFWSAEHPNTPGYADRYGIPIENITEANFIETAAMRPGSNFVTRVAPPVGTSRGGGLEIVIPQAERAVEIRGHTSQ